MSLKTFLAKLFGKPGSTSEYPARVRTDAERQAFTDRYMGQPGAEDFAAGQRARDSRFDASPRQYREVNRTRRVTPQTAQHRRRDNGGYASGADYVGFDYGDGGRHSASSYDSGSSYSGGGSSSYDSGSSFGSGGGSSSGDSGGSGGGGGGE